MLAFAATRRMPLRAPLVFRASTAEAYLATTTGSSRATVASRVNALVTAVTAALDGDPAAPEAGPAQAPADAHGVHALEARGEAEPLLLDAPAAAPATLRRLQLTGPAAADALAALAAVRARILTIEPSALRREDRFRGKGRSVPYGDVEVVAMLAAAATQRSTKRRLHVSAALCLGLGAGITGESASAVRGRDLVPLRDASEPTAGTDAVAVIVDGRLRPVHAAFVAPLHAAAAAAGPDGWLVGGTGARRTRIAELAAGLANTDPRLVRLNSTRLAATWLAMHAVRGVPVADLLAAAGHTTADPLTLVLPYLPRTSAGADLLTGHTAGAPASPRRTRDEHAAGTGRARREDRLLPR